MDAKLNEGCDQALRSVWRGYAWAGCLVVVLAPAASSMAQDQVDGFIEPYRTVDLAASEPGLVTRIDVTEGAYVPKNTQVAVLDTSVLEASLKIARQQMEARGELEAAEAELGLFMTKWRTLQRLRADGISTQEELERAAADVSIGQGRLKAAKEALAVRRLEYERIERQLENRRIRSPIDGVVTRVYREVGEYASFADPVVVTVVQLNPLRATFSVPSRAASGFQSGGSADILIGNRPVSATVEFVSPVTDPESTAVLVRVKIDNQDGSIRAGTQCALRLNR